MGHHRDTADGVQSTRRRLRRLHGDDPYYHIEGYVNLDIDDPIHDIDYLRPCLSGTCDHPAAAHDSEGRCYVTTEYGGSSTGLRTSCPCGR